MALKFRWHRTLPFVSSKRICLSKPFHECIWPQEGTSENGHEKTGGILTIAICNVKLRKKTQVEQDYQVASETEQEELYNNSGL